MDLRRAPIVLLLVGCGGEPPPTTWPAGPVDEPLRPTDCVEVLTEAIDLGEVSLRPQDPAPTASVRVHNHCDAALGGVSMLTIDSSVVTGPVVPRLPARTTVDLPLTFLVAGPRGRSSGTLEVIDLDRNEAFASVPVRAELVGPLIEGESDPDDLPDTMAGCLVTGQTTVQSRGDGPAVVSASFARVAGDGVESWTDPPLDGGLTMESGESVVVHFEARAEEPGRLWLDAGVLYDSVVPSASTRMRWHVTERDTDITTHEVVVPEDTQGLRVPVDLPETSDVVDVYLDGSRAPFFHLEEGDTMIHLPWPLPGLHVVDVHIEVPCPAR